MRRIDLTGSLAGAPLVTRFAPSPTGYLHLGHVINAIHVWGLARLAGGRVLLRIEDHDRTRSRPRYERALLEDLEWLGFIPDEGGSPVVRQSDRDDIYRAALDRLAASQRVFTCRCSRRDIGGERYDGTCRELGLTPRDSRALRLVMPGGTERFDDVLRGAQHQDPAQEYGDLLLRDRLGQWTYQFAVTVDDMVQGVTLVVRGTDLLSSTGRQLRLARLLGRPVLPVLAHHPLAFDATGRKLSKADGAIGVRQLRLAGLSPARVIGRAAALAGLTAAESEVEATAVAAFWDRI